MKKLELLAPAGNFESFYSAINNGADAVYLGVEEFNARGNIDNFTAENLRVLTEKAHLFGVKVYLALNILIKNDEFEHITSLVRKALDAKVDAFIIQDLGLAYYLKNRFPNINLHASTQMGVHNLEGAKFLQEFGFSRIVLARETPISEIKRIKDNLDIELEYFVQGALCVGFSGNCYLCAVLAGASGNRGKCKQFCRLPYQLNGGKKEGYLLSTKDICNLPVLKELADAGVVSFKIEGRARRPAYVAQAVATYRKVIDNNFNFTDDDLIDLKKVFNRGDFSQGYLSKSDKIIYSKSQNHIGVEIGRVENVNKGKRFNSYVISSSHKLCKGDGLKFFVKEEEIASIGVNDVKEIGKNTYEITSTTLIPKNAIIRLILDKMTEDRLLQFKRKLSVDCLFVGKVGERAKMYLMCGGVQVEVEGEDILQQSINQPLAEEECKTQFSKMGEEFELKSLKTDIKDVFMRKSELNALRRQAIEKLKIKLIQSNEENLKNADEEINFEINLKNNNKNVEKIEDKYLIYSPENYLKNDILQFCQKNQEKMVYLDLPIFATEQDLNFIKELLNCCDNLGIVANNYFALNLVDKNKIIIGSEMNVFNDYTINYYLINGYNKIILSKEINDISEINCQNGEIFYSNNKNLIYFKHCPIKEHIGGDCGDCKYSKNIEYKLGKNIFKLKRKKILSCLFYLEKIE